MCNVHYSAVIFDFFEKMESAGVANGCIFFNQRIFTMVIFYFIVLILEIF